MTQSQRRKIFKKSAKGNIKRHYPLFVMICLIAAVIGVAYTSSISLFRSMVDYDTPQQTTTYDTISGANLTDVINDILKITLEEEELKKLSTGHFGFVELGKQDGVFANFVNVRASGSPLVTAVSAVEHMITTHSIEKVGIFISSIFMLLVWIFFINTYRVIMGRFFLEGRLYEKSSLDNFLWLVRQKSFINASMTMLVTYIFQLLWNITIIGGIIKSYSYAMVPYIVAENPNIKPLEAITLSRKMMKGHKWELFVNDWSFIGWDILDIVFLFGLLNLFYIAPYKESTYAEYYTYFRNQAQKNDIPNAVKLNDVYLYEFATDKELYQHYANIDTYRAIVDKGYTQKHGIARFFADIFGVVLRYDESEEEYSHYMETKLKLIKYENACQKKSYPSLLSPNTVKKEKQTIMESLHCIRHYSVSSLILIFFTLCFIGWSWEVALHLVSDGVFVNRGVMHGPWLPIYGAGSIMIVIVLNKFRDKPIVEFLTAIVLCGIVEFFTSLQLEKSMGQKWWDYSGYFLNIDGRICAEGLLVFGLGGIAVVYLIAPFMDNVIKKKNLKVVIPICIILVSIFISDSIYSHFNPNTGKGITDYPTTSSGSSSPNP